jgi:hypothetical protein
MNEFGRRRSEIVRFLGALTDREKLLALAYLANDRMISARIPGLANTIMDMHRAHHRSALLKSVGTTSCNIDLELLARRKGCRLERALGSTDLWRIVSDCSAKSAPPISSGPALTPTEALLTLRALPDSSH